MQVAAARTGGVAWNDSALIQLQEDTARNPYPDSLPLHYLLLLAFSNHSTNTIEQPPPPDVVNSIQHLLTL